MVDIFGRERDVGAVEVIEHPLARGADLPTGRHLASDDALGVIDCGPSVRISGISHPIFMKVRRMPNADATKSEAQSDPTAPEDTFSIDRYNLPKDFPTHRHDAIFWEELGRVVGTFGFLEETLTRAIFALTATREYDDTEIEAALEKWPGVLEKAVTDALGAQIATFDRAVRDHTSTASETHEELVGKLRDAAELRNAVCHGSWRLPDDEGRSIPFYIDRKRRRFDTPVDVDFLRQTRQEIIHLVADVIDTVTRLGWQFPGSAGPGKVVWEKSNARER
ncbi:hypothetical protein [Sphingobium sp. MP9-4]|uniref:hypothetical protein n=1 Tax=Sphingobium sp. MP9-4 TaxID=1761936 RepID=UPI001F0DD749|nr:hypothetical protein [Sphingobium sp. MP9-4]